ncbi:ARID DNA-binding domain-containing protein, partial [Haematococcus lacustris]
MEDSAPIYVIDAADDPLRLLQRFRASDRGPVCKVVLRSPLPVSFDPTCTLDPALRFNARLEDLQQLQQGIHASQQGVFWARLLDYLQRRGRKLHRPPSLFGTSIDLYRLYCAVQEWGGCKECDVQHRWREVVRTLQVQHPDLRAAARGIKLLYLKLLLPLEQEAQAAQPQGVGQAQPCVQHAIANWTMASQQQQQQQAPTPCCYCHGTQ